MMGRQWHQLDHMQISCTSLQTDNHASTSQLSFLQTGCPSSRFRLYSWLNKRPYNFHLNPTANCSFMHLPEYKHLRLQQNDIAK